MWKEISLLGLVSLYLSGLFSPGVTRKVNDGNLTRFSMDPWVGGIHFKDIPEDFPSVFP